MSEPEEKKPRVEENVLIERTVDLRVEEEPMAELKVRMGDITRSLIRELLSDMSEETKRRLAAVRDLLQKIPSSMNMDESDEVARHYVAFGGWRFVTTLGVSHEAADAANVVTLTHRDDYECVQLRYEKWVLSIERINLSM